MRGGLLAFRLLQLGDDPLLQMRRNLVVVRKLYRVVAPVASGGLELYRVLQHLRQRDLRLNDLRFTLGLYTHHPSPLAVQIADHIPHTLIRDHDLDGHDGLQQGGVRLQHPLFKRQGSGNLKGHFRGVYGVVRTVKEGDLHIHNRISGQASFFHRLYDPFLNRRDILLGDRSCRERVHKFVAGAPWERFKPDPAIAVLSMTPGLLFVLPLDLGSAMDGLFVRHAWRLHLDVDSKLPLEPIDRNLQVGLRHPSQYDFLGLRIASNLKGWVLLSEPLQADAHFFLIPSGLGHNGMLNNGARDPNRLQDDGTSLIAKGIPCPGLFQLHHRPQVADLDCLNRDLIFAAKQHDLADPFLAALRAIVDAGIGRQRARVDAEQVNLTRVRIDECLKYEGCQWSVGAAFSDKALTAPWIDPRKGVTITRPDVQPLVAEVRALLRDVDSSRRSTDRGATWDPGMLRSVLRNELAGDEILLLSNREPYIHVRDGDRVIVRRPASGLVTAMEPIMRACSGTWIAHGSGSADRETADRTGHLRVPPENPAYTLRRVWLSDDEERGYYYGFANEGLWPLCHIAHVRPVFRTRDWEQYMNVNRRFADAVCAEADTADPVVLVQDYHFALAPRYIRQRLPKATIITFWHIPWPNPESFGICPWRAQIVEGLDRKSVV